MPDFCLKQTAKLHLTSQSDQCDWSDLRFKFCWNLPCLHMKDLGQFS